MRCIKLFILCIEWHRNANLLISTLKIFFPFVRHRRAAMARWWCGTSRSRCVMVVCSHWRYLHDNDNDICELLVSLQTQVIRWPLLQKTNDITNATSLCRLAWQPATGQVCVTDTPSPVPPQPLLNFFSNSRMFVSSCAVFGRSCGYKSPPVWARLLESHQLFVRWPADPGERCATPPLFAIKVSPRSRNVLHKSKILPLYCILLRCPVQKSLHLPCSFIF